ncbi:MAG: isochorismatase family protein [Acidobacteriales bacterium]|nr:isochorismatase family protein [Terriglobales bacterium]
MRMMVSVFVLAAGLAPAFGQRPVLKLDMRSRVEAFKGSGAWQEVRVRGSLPVRETALLICDMWDHHWCSGAERRVSMLAPKLAALVDRARSAGILIIHAPSDTLQFYADHPARRRMPAFAGTVTPAPLELTDPKLPIDDKEGGCDTGEKAARPWPWTRQHAAIHVAAEDAISDKGVEVYGLLRERGIKNLLITGVHTNMCVLNRTFAIKQMTRWGIRCVLVRDMTDAMYDPHKAPFVTHEQGTELVVQHIEKYWAPTVLSGELIRALVVAGAPKKR